MSKKQKERLLVACEFIISCIASIAFLTLSVLAFIFRHWWAMGYGAANCVIFGFYFIRSALRYFDLTEDGTERDDYE